jgi:hypothetical protein
MLQVRPIWQLTYRSERVSGIPLPRRGLDGQAYRSPSSPKSPKVGNAVLVHTQQYGAVRKSSQKSNPLRGVKKLSAIVLRSQSPRSRDTAFSSTRSRVAAPSQSINHPPLIDPYGQRIHHSRWPVISQSHTYTWSPQAAFRFSSSGSVGRPHGPLGVCGATVLGLADPPSSRCPRRTPEAMRARALTLT